MPQPFLPKHHGRASPRDPAIFTRVLCVLPLMVLGSSGLLLKKLPGKFGLVNSAGKLEVRDERAQGFLNLSFPIQKMEIMVIIILFSPGAPRAIEHFNGESTWEILHKC